LKIANRLEYFRDREKPAKQTKYKKDRTASTYLTKTKIKQDYKYYICDFCGEEIKIEKDIDRRTGGTCFIPKSLTGREEIELALHNRCLNSVLKEFEELRSQKNS